MSDTPDNVVSLESKVSEPFPVLVKRLESLLERARSGELRSIVYLAFQRDGTWESGNSGQTFNRAYVLGAFQQASLDYYHRRRDDDEEN